MHVVHTAHTMHAVKKARNHGSLRESGLSNALFSYIPLHATQAQKGTYLASFLALLACRCGLIRFDLRVSEITREAIG